MCIYIYIYICTYIHICIYIYSILKNVLLLFVGHVLGHLPSPPGTGLAKQAKVWKEFLPSQGQAAPRHSTPRQPTRIHTHPHSSTPICTNSDQTTPDQTRPTLLVDVAAGAAIIAFAPFRLRLRSCDTQELSRARFNHWGLAWERVGR